MCRFTEFLCLPTSPIRFKTWVELLYHGVPVESRHQVLTPSPLTPAPTVNSSSSVRPNLRHPWSFIKPPGTSIGADLRKLRKKRNRELVKNKRKEKRKSRRESKVNERKKRRRRGKMDAYEMYWRWRRRRSRRAIRQVSLLSYKGHNGLCLTGRRDHLAL